MRARNRKRKKSQDVGQGTAPGPGEIVGSPHSLAAALQIQRELDAEFKGNVNPKLDDVLAFWSRWRKAQRVNTKWKIGDRFTSRGDTAVRRITDVGTRVVVAIEESGTEQELAGPPYQLREEVWDENDQKCMTKIA